MLLNRRFFVPAIFLTIAVTTLPPAIAFSAPVAASPVREVSISRMGLGGIKLGMKAAQVQRKVGKPLKVESENSRCCGVLLHWQYSDLEVRLEVPEGRNQERNASVYSISTRSAKVATLEGIRVGDRRSKVIRAYGEPYGSGTTEDRIFYSNDTSASALVFRFKDDRVVEISANNQLN
ncbi:MAG: hypothetical protein KME10_18440 [Plectolyngbya sp. WJT66-NPBG17]|jgi:hypothetical protein|nr:hypothetical protein [Plectolyngbya sp. WJT66-NPBG17]MBW4527577.1 hypothetical protein [Phormidium tanganyikae FI6-MK23]